MPKSRFSRTRVLDKIVRSIHDAQVESNLARMATLFGLHWERGEPVPKENSQLWQVASNLGLVYTHHIEDTPDWTEVAWEVFPRLGFRTPVHIENAIDASDGKVVRIDPGVAKFKAPEPEESV